MSSEVVIDAFQLGKEYRIGTRARHHDTVRDLIADKLESLFTRTADGGERNFWALRDANFQIGRGENVGIIGLNGAGKSTLLKILSRITTPSAGRVRIVGRVGALLEVGTGFHPELTGRENVFLYGAILGMGRGEIESKFDAIVDFSGIEQFIDTPVKRYSSGMYVRLAFAVAAHLEPEILLLDEVLAVGDMAFQRKCIDFAHRLQAKNSTILFVSHNMFSIKTMCERVIYLKSGSIRFDGSTEEGIRLYEDECRLKAAPTMKVSPDEWPVLLANCELQDHEDRSRTVFDHGERMKVRLLFNVRRPLENPNVIVAFLRSDGVACCNYSSESDGIYLGRQDKTFSITLETPPLALVADAYTVVVLVRQPGFQTLLAEQVGGVFHVRHDLFDRNFGVFHEKASWKTAKATDGSLIASVSRDE